MTEQTDWEALCRMQAEWIREIYRAAAKANLRAELLRKTWETAEEKTKEDG